MKKISSECFIMKRVSWWMVSSSTAIAGWREEEEPLVTVPQLLLSLSVILFGIPWRFSGGSSEGPLQDFLIWDTFFWGSLEDARGDSWKVLSGIPRIFFWIFLGSLEDALGDPWKGLGICFWGSLEDSLGDPWKVLSRIFGFGILFWQPSKMLWGILGRSSPESLE